MYSILYYTIDNISALCTTNMSFNTKFTAHPPRPPPQPGGRADAYTTHPRSSLRRFKVFAAC